MAIRLNILKALKATLAGTGGFTLVELLVAISLLTIATGMIGGGMFQLHSVQRFWRDSVVAIREVRHAGSRFAGDALKAENVLNGPTGAILPCDASPPAKADSVTLILSDTSGPHEVTYRITGNTLTRNDAGAVTIVAREIVPDSVSFSLSCNNDLTFELEVDSDRGTRESISLITHIRKLD